MADDLSQVKRTLALGVQNNVFYKGYRYILRDGTIWLTECHSKVIEVPDFVNRIQGSVFNSGYSHYKLVGGGGLTSLAGLCYSKTRLLSVDLSELDTSTVTDMSSMFSDCIRLRKIKFGKNFDTSNVLSMKEMFMHCSYLSKVDMRGWNTGCLVDVTRMLAYCSCLHKAYIKLDNTGVETSEIDIQCNRLMKITWV